MTVFLIICTTIFLLYTGYLVLCSFAWVASSPSRSLLRQSKARKEVPPKTSIHSPISIIIPVRNEVGTIEQRINDLLPDIKRLQGSEIIIVNDESSDGTDQTLKQWMNEEGISVLDVQMGNGKKAAIRTGILSAQNDLILTTDADVRSSKGWANSVVEAMNSTEADMMLMPVLVDKGKGLLGQLQVMDQAILTGMAIGSAKVGMPVWASGAALAFSKRCFLEMDGYKGNERWASGDDVFLLHKFKASGKKVEVFNNSTSIVLASACESWSELITQRLRWGSKALAYRDPFTVFVSFLGVARWVALLAILFIAINSNATMLSVFLFGLATIVADLLLLNIVLRTTRLKLPRHAQIIVPVFYLFFGLFLMVASIVHTPQWKGRKTVGFNR